MLSRARRRSAIAGLSAAGALVLLVVIRNQLVPAPLERLEIDRSDGERAVHSGSWRFPRGGPYILGFESPGGVAKLSIDGRPIARGAGETTVRKVYPPGVVSVRFEAPPGARLLWHPPGRRGPLEYVPPSALAAEPPARARFGARAGSSPVDGAIALAMLAVIVVVVAYWARARLRRIDRRTAAWAGAAFALALAVRLVGLSAAGQTWDEDVNWSAGRNYITNILALDFEPSSWRWNHEHPPVMKYVAGIGAQLADGYGPARALSAVIGALACALLVPIGARLFSRRAGVLAAGAAALTPHLIAHSKVVGHEAPTMLLWTGAIALCIGVRDDDRARIPRRVALVGVVLGLAVFSRFVNALLAPLVGTLLLLYAPAGARKRTVWLGAAVIPVAVAVTGLAIWPLLWDGPVDHLLSAWDKLKKPHAPEPYLGAITNTPARHYFAVYLAATAPAGILAGAVLWLVRAGLWRERGSAALALWIAVPLLVLASPVRQDGVRYVMPSVIALAMAAGAGLDAAIAWLARGSPRRAKPFAALAGAALAAYLAVACARIHPYYLDYYGEHVGGPERVARTRAFEIAWWGEGLDRAIDYINRRAQPNARVHKRCVLPAHLAWLRHDLWAREARRPERADWILVYQPSWRRCPVPGDAELVHEVGVEGAPLARVYRR